MNRRHLWLLVVVAALVGVLAPTAVGAQSREERRRDEISREVQRLRARIDEVAAEEAHVLAELEVTRRAKAVLDARVAELDARIAGARAEVATAEADHRASVTAHRASERRLERARAELRRARDTLRAQAVTAFIRFGHESTPFEVLVEVRDLRELHAADAMVDSVAGAQADAIARHEVLRQDTARLARHADQARWRAEQRRDEVVARQTELEAARREQAAARGQAAAEVAREEHLLASARSSRREYEGRVATLRRESDQIADLLRRREAEARRQPGVRRATPSGRGVLAFPVANPVVTSGYGYRTHPIFGTRRLHAGIDLRAPAGTAIFSSGGGTVVYAGSKGGYGNAVVVDHGGALATLYGHLSRITVREGATVGRGQAIGTAGSTGYSTGPHLHFEVRVDGTPVDPLNYL